MVPWVLLPSRTHASVSAPCRLLAVSTSTKGPFAILRSSMKSKQSILAWPATTAGKYQPFGGADRRMRRTPSCSPSRASTRLIVASPGAHSISACSTERIARVPDSPRTLSRNSARSSAIRCSTGDPICGYADRPDQAVGHVFAQPTNRQYSCRSRIRAPPAECSYQHAQLSPSRGGALPTTIFSHGYSSMKKRKRYITCPANADIRLSGER